MSGRRDTLPSEGMTEREDRRIKSSVDVQLIRQLRHWGITIRRIAKLLHCSRNTVKRYLVAAWSRPQACRSCRGETERRRENPAGQSQLSLLPRSACPAAKL